MPDEYSLELETARTAVTTAAQICRSVQHELTEGSLEKKDKSPVTIADFASQAVICKQLRETFPHDPIVAEEDAAELREGENRLFADSAVRELQKAEIAATFEDLIGWVGAGNHDASGQRFWTLDPIDGTKGFLRREQFAISLALIVAGRIEVAVLACPNLPALDWDRARGLVFFAVRGQGARVLPLDLPHVTPHTVRVSTRSVIQNARVCESVESGHSAHDQSAAILQRLGITSEPVRMDSQAKYGSVARGEADLYLRLPTRAGYEEKIWDHAGGVLVVEEAGGRVTDLDGQPLDFSAGSTLKRNRGVIVSNGLLHDRALATVQDIVP
jgi:3'(2'), 5'-bisphosphate nucleotidase